MERVIWVEVLGRHGVTQRTRLAALPAVIGRGYDADVIVDDPLADARHARLAEDGDGALTLEDLGTLNGTLVLAGAGAAGRLVRGAAAALAPLTEVRIGQTRLRIATGEAAVPPARRDAPDRGGPWRALQTPRALVLVPLASVAASVLDLWLNDAGRKSRALAGDAVGLVALVAVWAGCWAVGGRINGRPARFGAHHALTWLFLLVVGLSSTLFAWLDFLFESRVLIVLGGLAGAVAFVLLLDGQLRLTSALAGGRRLAVAALVTGALTGIGLLVGEAARDTLGSGPSIATQLKPVPTALVPAVDIETFLQRAGRVRRTVDGLAAKD